VARSPERDALEQGSGDDRPEPPGELCRPWLDELTLYQDDTWCIVDKPAGVGCEPRDPNEADAPADLSERLARHYERLAPVPVLALPRRASGITLLGWQHEAAARGRPPLSELSAVVAIDGFRLRERGRLGGRGAGFGYHVHALAGRRALVRVELGDIAGQRPIAAALEALARAGQPVVGDHERGGAAATRLMLHVDSASGRVPLSTVLPAELTSWLEGLPTVAPTEHAAALVRAGVLRWGMRRQSDLLRLIDEGAGELSGVTIDVYGEYAVLSVSTPAAHALAPLVARELVRAGARGVYLKQRLRADLRRVGAGEVAPSEPIAGEAAPAELIVRHGPLAFEVRLGDGLATGLYVDQRSNWLRVMRQAQGASVLNLFCYTGAFSVAAAAGGARETLGIDLSGRALAQATQNLARNGFGGSEHRVLKEDVLGWLPRAVSAGRRFDWVILDPPSFGTRAKGVLDSERDYPALVRGCLQLLAPRGRLLCVSHHRNHDHDALAGLVRAAARGLGRTVKTRPLVGPWDCPTLPGVSGTKSVLVQAA
jgi:23S rRNA (cytosine1962-C5)-methyltransferase